MPVKIDERETVSASPVKNIGRSMGRSESEGMSLDTQLDVQVHQRPTGGVRPVTASGKESVPIGKTMSVEGGELVGRSGGRNSCVPLDARELTQRHVHHLGVRNRV